MTTITLSCKLKRMNQRKCPLKISALCHSDQNPSNTNHNKTVTPLRVLSSEIRKVVKYSIFFLKSQLDNKVTIFNFLIRRIQEANKWK